MIGVRMVHLRTPLVDLLPWCGYVCELSVHHGTDDDKAPGVRNPPIHGPFQGLKTGPELSRYPANPPPKEAVGCCSKNSSRRHRFQVFSAPF